MIRVAAEGVTKTYNRGRPDEATVLKEVSVEVEPGEVAVIRGPSGSGKTTLLCILGCMARPTSGRVWVGDENVAKLPERFLSRHHRETFGFIFQQYHLLLGLTALENVMIPLYPTGLGFPAMRERAAAALERVGLTHRLRARPGRLSGGEQQRVAVARALVNDPDVVIADEPTAHLDEGLSRDLLKRLEAIREEGRTVIIATHDPMVHEASFVDRVIDLRDGMVKGVVRR
jgi:putative ABC transport system ATP-binding protein